MLVKQKSKLAPISELSNKSIDEPTYYAEAEAINRQLDNWRVVSLAYLGVYSFLFFGMLTGTIWEWINAKKTETSTFDYGTLFKGSIRLFIGSLISFSFFIGPIMGIGEIGLSFSSAILAFHFGIGACRKI